MRSKSASQQHRTHAAAAVRVLVVDDDESICQSTAQLLRLQGYETRTAFNGQDAIEQVSSFVPNLVLLDIEMSEMDGWEVARTIRRTQGLAEPVIAAVSGYRQLFHKRVCAAAGFDHYLEKPVDPAVFDQLLRFVNGSGGVIPGAPALLRERIPACYGLVRSQLEFGTLILDSAAIIKDKTVKARFWEKVVHLQTRLETFLAAQPGFSEEQLSTLQILLFGLQIRLTTLRNRETKYLH